MDNTTKPIASATGGFIKLYRAVEHSWVFQDKPFNALAAWTHLLLTAAWRAHQIPHGADQQRGEVITSQYALGKVWGWDRKKVRRFLETLESKGMARITTDAGRATGGTRIVIINYEKYQGDASDFVPPVSRACPESAPLVPPVDFIGENRASSPINSPISPPYLPHFSPPHKKLRSKEGKKTDNRLLAAGADSERDSDVVSKDELQRQALELYKAYPKHVAKDAALKAILNSLTVKPFADLMEAVQAFAKAQRGQVSRFIPHPSTWFNQGRYDDDRASWSDWKHGHNAGVTKTPEEVFNEHVAMGEKDLDGKPMRRPRTGPLAVDQSPSPVGDIVKRFEKEISAENVEAPI